ncbi:hypothetical protein [Novosphingobium sp. KACC 22771]|uniref:hypothetical protein n=1 Tax=Novosphingobium sp. KACC 22771 TaxID=3025670 RepID=UPI0023661695|nr:hypothetical protein [Novosphingobium sp. KACC 22771]WDF73474.1 hypothetical protein PQ467_05360 [Novosphingobium sp. KACC 22771]
MVMQNLLAGVASEDTLEAARLLLADIRTALQRPNFQAAASTPVSGSRTTSGATAAFTPEPGRDMLVQLTGDWAGSVQLERSLDEGVTWCATTLNNSAWALYTRNVSEAPVTPSSTSERFRLNATLVSGTLNFLMKQ